MKFDRDGLWLCDQCAQRTSGSHDEYFESEELDGALTTLVGKSAGAICRTLNLLYEQPYNKVINAASAIGYDYDLYMSEWSFVALWLDGTTTWRSPDDSQTAIVSANGELCITTEGF